MFAWGAPGPAGWNGKRPVLVWWLQGSESFEGVSLSGERKTEKEGYLETQVGSGYLGVSVGASSALTMSAVLPHDLRVWMVKLEWTLSIDTPLTMTIWSL